MSLILNLAMERILRDWSRKHLSMNCHATKPTPVRISIYHKSTVYSSNFYCCFLTSFITFVILLNLACSVDSNAIEIVQVGDATTKKPYAFVDRFTASILAPMMDNSIQQLVTSLGVYGETYKIAVQLVQDTNHTRSGFAIAFVVVSLPAMTLSVEEARELVASHVVEMSAAYDGRYGIL